MAANLWSWEDIELIRKHPEILGLLAGKDKLTSLHGDWMTYLLDANEERTLQAHRGSFKTTAVIEIGVIWYLMFHPDARIGILCKSYTAAAERVRNISNIMMMPEIYSLLAFAWGEKWKFTVRREGKLELSVKKSKTKEVSVTALGVDSGVTGSHFTLVIGDDVVDLKDRVSEAEREKTKYVLQEYRANILDPGCYMQHIGTPWHKHDAWEILPNPKRYSILHTGLVDKDREKEIRGKTTPILFAINYLLTFEREDDMLFQNPRIGKWHETNSQVTAHVDAAFDGDNYCALTIMGRMPDGKLNAVGFVYEGNIKDWFSELAKKMIQYGAFNVHIEDNADKGYSADIFKLNDIVKENHIWVDLYHESMKKEVKIATYAAEVWKDIEWAADTMPEYLEQCTDWRPKMEPDDAPDSLASLCREANFTATKNFSTAMWSW